MPIRNDTELKEKLEQLSRLYPAVRQQFAKITVTETTGAALVLGAGKIVDKITALIADIEEYSGAAEIRRLNVHLKEIREKRRKSNG